MTPWRAALSCYETGLTTHSTGAEIDELSSARLKAWLEVYRQVNAGVRRLPLKNMKLILVTSILLGLLMPPVVAQQRKRPQSRRKVRNTAQSVSNQSLIIKSFKSSSPTAVIPCPPGTPLNTFCYANGMTPKLMTEAFDRNRYALIYQYSVSGGRILGEGANVVWDLTGMPEGSYTAKIVVKNERGDMASSSLNVNVIACYHCGLRPCVTVSVSCSDEAEEGQSLIFTAYVSGGELDVKPNYKWSVSTGTIIKGQGTNMIEVDSTDLGGQQVEATVEVGGYPPECNSRSSCKLQVRKKNGK
jgi:hypothetical protein